MDERFRFLLPLFIDVCLDAFVDGVGSGGTARHGALKESCAVADSELTGLAAVALADADFFVEVLSDSSVMQCSKNLILRQQ